MSCKAGYLIQGVVRNQATPMALREACTLCILLLMVRTETPPCSSGNSLCPSTTTQRHKGLCLIKSVLVALGCAGQSYDVAS